MNDGIPVLEGPQPPQGGGGGSEEAGGGARVRTGRHGGPQEGEGAAGPHQGQLQKGDFLTSIHLSLKSTKNSL